MKITEIFHSIQGEGYLIGEPMLFVRTNGCNLRCRWCDSTYTFQGGQETCIDDIIEIVSKSSEKWICLTGGEPLLQRQTPDFLKRSIEAKKMVLIETGGSLSIEKCLFSNNTMIDMDIKTPSSGENRSLYRHNLDILRNHDYIKFVISNQEDYDFSKEFLNDLDRPIRVVFQPAWGTDIKWITEQVLQDHLDVRVLPQLHKIIWGDRRGV
ncbi:radical SAM protein [Oxyplasma meridianum]|uniref:7-carboxy-7-deazaguanine synthase n=1 Tax=Oxyplasma meridianum TaxID=3073602 RepID=A0AAX4NHI4_9ARCH